MVPGKSRLSPFRYRISLLSLLVLAWDCSRSSPIAPRETVKPQFQVRRRWSAGPADQTSNRAGLAGPGCDPAQKDGGRLTPPAILLSAGAGTALWGGRAGDSPVRRWGSQRMNVLCPAPEAWTLDFASSRSCAVEFSRKGETYATDSRTEREDLDIMRERTAGGPEAQVENRPLDAADRERIGKETGWSPEIVAHIPDTDQLRVYLSAGLHEKVRNGKPGLEKKIDLDFVDPKTGLTNRERMQKGRAPIDAASGEKIELHHMGQEADAPLAELNENSEHGDGNHSVLHPKKADSWRASLEKRAQSIKEKVQHWRERAVEEQQ